MHFSAKNALALAALAIPGMIAARPAAAQYAHLTLQSQPGDYIGQGRNYDLTYTPANGFSAAQVRRTVAGGLPGELDFALALFNPDTNALLFFGTDALGVPIQPGTYTNAQRADFAAPGHAGLDVSFGSRGNNTITGSFTITDVSFTPDSTAQNGYLVNTFDATFEQHGEGLAPALFGTFSYRSTGAPVPEASMTVSFGLLLVLGGLVIASKRKKASSAL